ncbi:MAG TPA: phage major capsid protein [Planctomycetota bacterium]|nr:phage major capsid protein [Planctomycetota bacterium]
MSDVTTALSDILPILAETFDEPIRSTINRESPLLNWLPKVPYAGEQVDWRVSTGGLTVLNPASAAAWGDASRDTKRKLTLAWGRYAVKILIGYDALTAAARAPSGMFNLLMTEAQEAARQIAKGLNNDCYDGSGSEKIIGLNTAIDSTGSYAGLHESDDDAWKSTENGALSTTLSEAILDDHLEDIAALWGSPLTQEDIIVMPFPHRGKLKALLTASSNRTHQIITNAGGQSSVTLHGGASGTIFSDVPVIADSDCPTDTIFALRRSEIVFKYMPFVVPGTDQPVMVNVKDRNGNVIGQQPAMVHVVPLSKTGDHVQLGLIVQGQLQVTHRAAHGKLFASHD